MEKLKKLFVVLIVLIFTFSLGIGIVPEVKAVTAEELRAKIAELQAQIAKLQKQLEAIEGTPTKTWCHNFYRNLRYGDRGPEVYALQEALRKEGFKISEIEHTTRINAYFGITTASSVVGFQEKYKEEILVPWSLRYGTGFVGKTTRKKLNELYGCGVIPPLPPITCFDTDGGKNYYVKGTVSSKSGLRTDICGKGNDLIEYYCEGDRIRSIIYNCPNGCKDGACMKKSSVSCYDSDGGADYYKKGTTTLTEEYGNSSKIVSLCKDFCRGNTLYEYFCSTESDGTQGGKSIKVKSVEIICPNGCQDGACKAAIQKCIDGTPYGQCSSEKPKYCDNGNLVDRCDICGCPSGYSCQENGKCVNQLFQPPEECHREDEEIEVSSGKKMLFTRFLYKQEDCQGDPYMIFYGNYDNPYGSPFKIYTYLTDGINVLCGINCQDPSIQEFKSYREHEKGINEHIEIGNTCKGEICARRKAAYERFYYKNRDCNGTPFIFWTGITDPFGIRYRALTDGYIWINKLKTCSYQNTISILSYRENGECINYPTEKYLWYMCSGEICSYGQ